MPSRRTTTVYMIGDAGRDRLTFPGMTGTVQVPSGVFFMKDALPILLGREFSIAPLISEDRDRTGVKVARATPTKRAELRAYPPNGVLRIADYSPVSSPDADRELWLHAPTGSNANEFLVAHHAGETWDTPADLAPLRKLFAHFEEPDETSDDLPRILVNLSAQLPALKRNVDFRDGTASPFASPLWNDLYAHRTNVGIVVSVATLRAEGVAVSRRLSWEQGVEDLAAELHLFPHLRALTRFRHLFIRVGMVGFIHVQWDASTPSPQKLSGHVYFAPNAKDAIHRDRDVEGQTIGQNTLFIAALLRAFRERSSSATRSPRRSRRSARSNGPADYIRRAMTRALVAMRAVDDAGYSAEALEEAARGGDGSSVLTASMATAADILGRSTDSTDGVPEQDVLGWRTIPDYLLLPPPSDALRSPRRWHILDDVLVEAPVHRINVAMAMVKAGHGRVLNRVWSEDAAHGRDAEIWNLLTRVEYWNRAIASPTS